MRISMPITLTGDLSATLHRGITYLEEEAVDSLKDFVIARQNGDGGFRGRSQESDLYYTGFAIDILSSGHNDYNFTKTIEYLLQHLSFDTIKFVDLISLIRSLYTLCPAKVDKTSKKNLQAKLTHYKAQNGGYHQIAGSKQATAYDTFLYLLAAEYLGLPLKEVPAILRTLFGLANNDGSFANHSTAPTTPAKQQGTTAVTAAAACLLKTLHKHKSTELAIQWLLDRSHQAGGFSASPQAPAPDLLSTAVSLFAIRTGAQLPYSIAGPTMDFIEECWQEDGGFSSHPADPVADIEYSYYALLAIGSIAL